MVLLHIEIALETFWDRMLQEKPHVLLQLSQSDAHVLHGIDGEFVALPVGDARFDSASRQPHGEGVGMVVPAPDLAVLDVPLNGDGLSVFLHHFFGVDDRNIRGSGVQGDRGEGKG